MKCKPQIIRRRARKTEKYPAQNLKKAKTTVFALKTDYSSNGTFDGDGNRLTRAVATPMTAGSVIAVGEEKFRLG